MKISLLAAVGTVCLFSVSALHAQSDTTTRTARTKGVVTRTTSTTITRNNNRRPNVIQRTTPTVTVAPRTDGVLPRAIRSGSPLQMINPFAPASYGSGQEVARHEPSDPYAKPQGIKIATVDF